jgi:UDP-glucose 4-epimerase
MSVIFKARSPFAFCEAYRRHVNCVMGISCFTLPAIGEHHMSRILVTGGAGFIGSHLVDALLAGGHAVTVVDDLSTGHRHNLDPNARLIVGDVADPVLMRAAMAEADACFHLAAIASVARGNTDWSGTHRTNLSGTIVVFDAARAAGRIPVVYASSAAVYGMQPDLALHENLTPAPLSAYGADKLGCELHAAVAWGVHGVPTCGFRFFNVYGPRQDPKSPYSGVISIFADRIARGGAITIDGDGGQTRDFIYVADIIRHLIAGLDLLLVSPGSAVFNACTGHATSIRELAETIAVAADQEPNLAFGPARPGDIRSSLGNPNRAIAALGIKAETRLLTGLAKTLASLQVA